VKQHGPTAKRLLACTTILLCVAFELSGVMIAEDQSPKAACADTESANAPKTGTADGASSPNEMGKRHPLYRLNASDVLEVDFTFAPEYDQTVTVQPDGFITLKGIKDLYAEGITLGELRQRICQAYAGSLHEPEVTITLKDFEKPYFVASGQVARPGKYELHGDATVTEGLAIAGGFTEAAKHSQVILFRRVSDDRVETHILNVKEMLHTRNLAEDVRLRAGDMLWVPQNKISKIRRYLPISSLSLYLNPTQF